MFICKMSADDGTVGRAGSSSSSSSLSDRDVQEVILRFASMRHPTVPISVVRAAIFEQILPVNRSTEIVGPSHHDDPAAINGAVQQGRPLSTKKIAFSPTASVGGYHGYLDTASVELRRQAKLQDIARDARREETFTPCINQPPNPEAALDRGGTTWEHRLYNEDCFRRNEKKTEAEQRRRTDLIARRIEEETVHCTFAPNIDAIHGPRRKSGLHDPTAVGERLHGIAKRRTVEQRGAKEAQARTALVERRRKAQRAAGATANATHLKLYSLSKSVPEQPAVTSPREGTKPKSFVFNVKGKLYEFDAVKRAGDTCFEKLHNDADLRSRKMEALARNRDVVAPTFQPSTSDYRPRHLDPDVFRRLSPSKVQPQLNTTSTAAATALDFATT